MNIRIGVTQTPKELEVDLDDEEGAKAVEQLMEAMKNEDGMVWLTDKKGRRVGVQLYGTEPNTPLVEFLERAGATVRCVAPYVYADAADDAAVQGLIARLSAGEVDAIAFTSTPQVERLFAVAPAATVCAALGQTLVAAVGPVVAGALERHGVRARLMPEESFFLKPLTTVLEEALGART